MSKVDPQRRIDVEWDIGEEEGEGEEVTYPVHIQVDCEERRGTLAELSGAIAEANANISYAHVETTPDQHGLCDFTVHVTDKEHLRRVVQNLKRLKCVQKVTRLR
jgi:GTP pyrophosphokinase